MNLVGVATASQERAIEAQMIQLILVANSGRKYGSVASVGRGASRCRLAAERGVTGDLVTIKDMGHFRPIARCSALCSCARR